MNTITNAGRFDQAISGLSDRLRKALLKQPQSVKAAAFEVRLRVDRPVALTWSGKSWFLDHSEQLSNSPLRGFIVTREDIEESILKMCSYSLHSHQDELRNGFLSLYGGHRAGVCGTAVLSGGKIGSIRDITSINLRIARDIQGAATPIVERVFRDGVKSLLIVGPPSSGKTTVLRDLARQLSAGEAGGFRKVAVVDERGELGAVYDGIPQNDLGPCCDILSGYPKAEGILTAVRTLSPQVILCDEIGGEEEVSGMLDGVNCGVKMIATAHAATMTELLGRRQLRRLLDYGVFDQIVRLSGSDEPGRIVETREVGELFAEDRGTGSHSAVLFHGGDGVFGEAFGESFSH